MSRTLSVKRRLSWPEALPESLRTVGRASLERSEALFAALRSQAHGIWTRSDEEVAQAWNELLEHPELMWVPPMWRSVSPSTKASPHTVSAVERNLKVDIVAGPRGRTQVRLMTGKLHDRRMGRGVDPTTPVVSVDPKLTVTAPTFEQAVLELRNAVIEAYGVGPINQARHHHAARRRPRALSAKRSLPSAH